MAYEAGEFFLLSKGEARPSFMAVSLFPPLQRPGVTCVSQDSRQDGGIMQPAISMVSVPTAVGRYAVLAASTIPFRPCTVEASSASLTQIVAAS